MKTALTVLAGLVLAIAATAGVVVSQADTPPGTPDTSVDFQDVSDEDVAAVYDVGP
jgi:hypothetical protein